MDNATAEGETFAALFAEYLVHQQSYGRSTPLVMQSLADSCDYLLTKADGLELTVAAIIDRQAHPEKIFSLSVVDTQNLADACWLHAERLGQATKQATINIYEIGPNIIDAAATARLAPYKPGARPKATVQAWLMDTEELKVWTNGPRSAVNSPRALEKLLRSPQRLACPQPAQSLAIAERPLPPFFTFGLIVLLAIIFELEVAFSLDPTTGLAAPSLRSLLAFGGVNRTAVVDFGQWWRIFTAPLLHADLSHVGFNCLALFLIGRRLEPLIGWRWTAAAFAVSAVCGSLMSLAINPSSLVGVGASGGIVGLFATGIIATGRIPAGIQRTRLIRQAMFGLIPALLPFLNGAANGQTIDYGAHFGGAIGGVAVGIVLIRLWPAEIVRPKLPRLALAISVVFLLVGIGAIFPIVRSYGEQALIDPTFPTVVKDAVAQSPQIALQYPHDPRARFDNAIVFVQQGKLANAEAELKAALADKDVISDLLTPHLEERIDGLLSIVLYEEGKKLEALQVARPVCSIEKTDVYAKLIEQRSLCP